MIDKGRPARQQGFSIVEALVAIGLVVLALVGVFGTMPYTYRTLQDDALRAEAAHAGQRYLDAVRLTVQQAVPLPAPTRVPLAPGASLVTGRQLDTTAVADLSATCTKPDGPASSLYDCTVSVVLEAAGQRRPLPPLETLVTRQLP